MEYVIAAGTNIGDRLHNINAAVDAFKKVPKTKVLKVSSVYETEPVGYAEQQNFYNAAFLIDSSFNEYEMLGICMGIEASLGRIRKIKNGPRIIDLDIIFAENKVINSENLILPHPRYSQRRFVLRPLADIFSEKNAYGFDFSKFENKISGQYIKKAAEKIEF